MPDLIEPTVGRMLWYRSSDGVYPGDGNPLAAQIAHVHDPRRINIGLLDKAGFPHARQDEILVQPGDAVPVDIGYCEWMLYELGQAGFDPAT